MLQTCSGAIFAVRYYCDCEVKADSDTKNRTLCSDQLTAGLVDTPMIKVTGATSMMHILLTSHSHTPTIWWTCHQRMRL
jgi:hypothetical protein